MRTTIRIDDDLYRAVKARAARTGRPVAAVIEDAVRESLARSEAAASKSLQPLPTFGGSGVREGVDLSSNAAVLEVLDEDEPVDALR